MNPNLIDLASEYDEDDLRYEDLNELHLVESSYRVRWEHETPVMGNQFDTSFIELTSEQSGRYSTVHSFEYTDDEMTAQEKDLRREEFSVYTNFTRVDEAIEKSLSYLDELVQSPADDEFSEAWEKHGVTTVDDLVDGARDLASSVDGLTFLEALNDIMGEAMDQPIDMATVEQATDTTTGMGH